MSAVTVLVVRRKAIDVRGLADAVTAAVQARWRQASPPRRPTAKQPNACTWFEDVRALQGSVVVPADAVANLRPYAFGALHDAVGPVWKWDKPTPRSFLLTDFGWQLIEAANRALCERYDYSTLGVWHALAAPSPSCPPLTFDAEPQLAAAFRSSAFSENELRFLQRR